MKKVILGLMVVAMMSLNAKVYYVGDKKAETFYSNDKMVENFIKNYGGDEPIVLYYVKNRKGHMELSSESGCCSSISLATGKCFELYDSKLVKEAK